MRKGIAQSRVGKRRLNVSAAKHTRPCLNCKAEDMGRRKTTRDDKMEDKMECWADRKPDVRFEANN